MLIYDRTTYVVTHVGPSDTVDHPGAIDADVELPSGWSVSVTLMREGGRWIPAGEHWLSDPFEVAETDRGALVAAVNSAAHAAGLSVTG